MSSSSNNPFSVYGTPSNTGSPLGMGSLQNLNRSGSSLAQLSRAAVASQSSSSVVNSSLMGFNSTVGGGRVTPTSSSSSFSSGLGGFPGGTGFGSTNAQPPHLSRPLGNFQQSTSSMSSSSAVVSSGRNPLFSGDRSRIGDSLSSSAFDPSEFPSLGSRDNNSAPNPALARSNYGVRDINTSTPNPAIGRSNYVGMVKQPAMEASEFTMSNEDFPALPGATRPAPAATSSPAPITDGLGPGVVGGIPGGPQVLSHVPPLTPDMLAVGSRQSNEVQQPQQQQQPPQQQQQQQQQQPRRGIQTSPSGLVTNIPQSMVTDQFGMIGLLTFIRAAETDPNLVSLALGADLTTLGLNLNSEVNLYPTFGGPWADTPCRPQDIDYPVPYEYLTNTTIRDKLAPVKLNRYKDDVLFYMFYTNVGDVLQLAAAAELYNRDWRYHKEDRVWITRAPGMPPSEKTQSYERGTYYFFDVGSWRKVPKEFHLDYDKLEDRPSLPTNLAATARGPHSGVPSSAVPPSSAGSPAPPPMAGLHQAQISPNMNSGGPMPPPGGL